MNDQNKKETNRENGMALNEQQNQCSYNNWLAMQQKE